MNTVSVIRASFVIGAIGTAHAQGFDCRKAVERTACAAPELNSLEMRIANAWHGFKTVYREQIRPATSDVIVTYKQRKACAQSPDVIGCIHDAENARSQMLAGTGHPRAARVENSQTPAHVVQR